MPKEPPENYLDEILDEYTGSDREVSPEVEEIVTKLGNLDERQGKVAEELLKRKGIDSLDKLEPENTRKDILKLLTGLLKKGELNEEVEEAVEEVEEVVQLKESDKITGKNVDQLLGTFPQNHSAIEMLNKLSATEKVKALNTVKIKLVYQMDINNEILMHRLKDAATTVLTKIGTGKGRGPGILTPTGSGKNR